ncbi:MAG TPA: phospholipid scramblase-related protein [Planctomycetota bacterium]|nr:phospholipid scramblase-related protein [Planctomycetota bacterium]
MNEVAEQATGGGMDQLIGAARALLVRQVKEWGEILLGFEARNRFEIFDATGRTVGFAAEESGGFGTVILRNLFGRLRAAVVHIYEPAGRQVARCVKPFRFYFHRVDIFEGEQRIGAVERRFSIFHRLFDVEDADGRALCRIRSPWLRIWTFKLLVEGQEVGRISKKWGGLLREMFTDADTFGVEFTHPELPAELKKLLLGATFLVDFTCFENNQGSRSPWNILDALMRSG